MQYSSFKDDFQIIAGPCAVEDRDSLEQTAALLKKHNVKILRGGSFKLRTSPNSFQGMGIDAVVLLSKIAKEYDLFSLTEVVSIEDIDFIYRHIDIFLVGTRNMHNYPLLKELGKTDKPIILKRGMAATAKEWLLAAEYISSNGNDNIILCERGIRTYETITRNTFDLATAIYLAQNCAYPVITDPSHATGNKDLVTPLTLASFVAGIHGVMIEIHPNPENALSDSEQMLDFAMFETLMKKMELFHAN